MKRLLRLMAGLLPLLIVAGVLGGCAADPRYKQGLNWVVSNEEEKARLHAQGFPQYSVE
jgi:hypothetical protein